MTTSHYINRLKVQHLTKKFEYIGSTKRKILFDLIGKTRKEQPVSEA